MAADAKLKPEFLIHGHVRALSLEYVADEDKQKLSLLADERENAKDSQSVGDGDKPPKKKLKGQNKRRPYDAIQIPRSEKLCPRIAHGDDCPYNEKCDYVHDIRAYLAKKQPDIGDRCYLFDTFGRCPYGASCRFASVHLNEEFKNVENSELSLSSSLTATRNGLPKDVQAALRKRHYEFKDADRILGSLKEFMRLKSERSKGENSGNANDMAAIDASTKGGNRAGAITDEDVIRTRPSEIKRIDFSGKLYLAPLTTVGNLPFRRICKKYGADMTCGEMAMAQNLLQGQQSEWALLKRHESEDLFGVQICGAHADQMSRCAQLLRDVIDIDFIDINVGCPIDLVHRRGAGCGLMDRLRKFEEIVYGMRSLMDIPLTAKIRTGVHERKNTAHTLLPKIRDWGVDMVTMHGRSREQRYTKSADWDYIDQCAKVAAPMPLFGCGDLLSYEDVERRLQATSVSGVAIARGALIKPWIFTEIKERKHMDVSSHERMEMLKDFVHFGLEHWGSDTEGVEKTRKFLLEWLSFLYRYIPVGILVRIPQKINERPPYYRGRDDLETLMASACCADWIKLSEMLLGPVPLGFSFLPKHKANSYT